jgi:UDP-N-acetyl-D-mannosaminuronic acid dehydrogenase
MKNKKISIIGGAGHVGMPLGLKFAQKGYKVVAIDKNKSLNKLLNAGKVPYKEFDAKNLLKSALKNNKIYFTNSLSQIVNSDFIIITVGTPIAKNKSPNMKYVFKVIDEIKKYLNNNQSIILRSTIYPGTSNKVIKKLNKINLKTKVSYCPERVAQGKSIYEIENLTQIVSSENSREVLKISKLFKSICKRVEILNFIEAEYSKLFSNAWRYIKFAVANEFYMISKEKNFDFNKVYSSMTKNYPRNKDLPKQGFAGGPCLPKDSIQLWHSCKKYSKLAINSYEINESLPSFLAHNLNNEINIKNKKIGVLGTTFKSGIDDERDSLSLKLINHLKKFKAKVYFYDPYSNSKNQSELNFILKNCKIIIIGTPHPEFKKINFKNKKIIDCWNFIN